MNKPGGHNGAIASDGPRDGLLALRLQRGGHTRLLVMLLRGMVTPPCVQAFIRNEIHEANSAPSLQGFRLQISKLSELRDIAGIEELAAAFRAKQEAVDHLKVARVLREAQVEANRIITALDASLKRLSNVRSGEPHLSIKSPFRPRPIQGTVLLKADGAIINAGDILLPEM